MRKDLNYLYIAIVGVVALFLAFSCNAQGLTQPLAEPGVYWEQIVTNPPVLVKVEPFVDGGKRTEYPMEYSGGNPSEFVNWDTTTGQSIKYAQPRLEHVTVNGKAVYIQVWDLIPAEYITYSFDARHFDAQHMPEAFPDTTINDVVARVHDGDSYYLKGMADFVRIAGVDAPEIYWGPGTKEQDFGRAIGDSVRLALKGRSVTYAFLGMDELKRPLVIVYVDGKDFAETLLSKGWAWSYGTKKLPTAVNKRYKSLMNEAKKKKLGLWKGKAPVKPWVHRSQYRRIWSK
jgi:micrococcal nuclease